MSYVLLRYGDRLPAVGVLQKLLNRTGASLKADGIFGNRTKAAVQAFQSARHLLPDGIVGRVTWPRLVAATVNLRVVDCIDVFDPDLFEWEARDIRRAGGSPILIGGMSNGVEQAVAAVCGAASPGSVFLLRFHGHGRPGSAGISMGQGGMGEHLASIHAGNLQRVRGIICRLRPIFGSYGCVQFMHCETGRGPKGRHLLSAIARDLGVPVSAAVNIQYGGGTATFRFEGATYTATPGGGTLESWCGRVPDFAGMSVA